MNALNDPEGIAFLLIFGVLGIIVLLIALVIEKVVETRRFRIDAFDARRCERAGSQDEFSRRLRARGLQQ